MKLLHTMRKGSNYPKYWPYSIRVKVTKSAFWMPCKGWHDAHKYRQLHRFKMAGEIINVADSKEAGSKVAA